VGVPPPRDPGRPVCDHSPHHRRRSCPIPGPWAAGGLPCSRLRPTTFGRNFTGRRAVPANGGVLASSAASGRAMFAGALAHTSWQFLPMIWGGPTKGCRRSPDRKFLPRGDYWRHPASCLAIYKCFINRGLFSTALPPLAVALNFHYCYPRLPLRRPPATVQQRRFFLSPPPPLWCEGAPTLRQTPYSFLGSPSVGLSTSSNGNIPRARPARFFSFAWVRRAGKMPVFRKIFLAGSHSHPALRISRVPPVHFHLPLISIWAGGHCCRLRGPSDQLHQQWRCPWS